MEHNKKNIQEIFSYILLVIAIIALVILLQPVGTVIILSILTVYMLLPVYTLCRTKMPKRLSMVCTWIVIICIILVPLAILLGIIGDQTNLLISDLSNNLENKSINTYGAIEFINSWLTKIPYVDVQIDIATLQNRMVDIAQRASQQVSSIVGSIGSSVINLLTSGILYIFTVSGLLVGYKKLLNYIKDILPIDKKLFNLYEKNLGGMGASMVKATIIIALIQSIVTAISLWIVGVPYIGLWSVLAFLFSTIPMIGSSFIVVPIGIIWGILGNVGGAIVLILVNQIITNNIDNILRPKLVSKEIKINETLNLLSVFGGISLFGLLGVIYGPVIMSFILVTFDTYKEK